MVDKKAQKKFLDSLTSAERKLIDKIKSKISKGQEEEE